jgi:hypothetical protein
MTGLAMGRVQLHIALSCRSRINSYLLGLLRLLGFLGRSQCSLGGGIYFSQRLGRNSSSLGCLEALLLSSIVLCGLRTARCQRKHRQQTG